MAALEGARHVLAGAVPREQLEVFWAAAALADSTNQAALAALAAAAALAAIRKNS